MSRPESEQIDEERDVLCKAIQNLTEKLDNIMLNTEYKKDYRYECLTLSGDLKKLRIRLEDL